MASGSESWETTDLGSAAYAHSRGLRIRDVIRSGTSDVVFVFEDPNNRGVSLKYEWANSPERAFDESVRTLKKLAFGGGRSERGRR